MASDEERRRRHDEAMLKAYAILSGQKSTEQIREEARRTTQKAKRLLARLDAKDAAEAAVRLRSQETTRRAREMLARLDRKEKFSSLAGLNKRLLNASESRRREIINEVISESLSRWPITKRSWRGKPK